jgi:hypothetical protein
MKNIPDVCPFDKKKCITGKCPAWKTKIAGKTRTGIARVEYCGLMRCIMRCNYI